MIDSHQHFWSVARGDYAWMGPHVAGLQRDFLPADLAPHLDAAGVSRTILVQAAETDAETDFLLDLAEATPFVAGVVGWIDLDGADFPRRFAALRRAPKLVGLRPMLQDCPDDAFILRPRVLDNLAAVAESGLAFDILCFTRHLPHVREALSRTPGLRAVLDHCAKPGIAAGRLDRWRDEVAALAAIPGVRCKVSGLVTEAAPDGWTPADLRPVVEHVLASFGPGRLMFGSDWPVCTLAASYGEVFDAARTLLAPHLGPADMERVFGGNAEAFYLGEAKAAAARGVPVSRPAGRSAGSWR